MPRGQRKTYVATETFVCEIDGRDEWVRVGQTRVSGDSELLARYRHAFKEAEQDTPEVEQATAAPGEKRGDPKR